VTPCPLISTAGLPRVPLLQAAYPGLTVSFTLPVLPTGLTADGVSMLQDAHAAGVRIDVINLMTMDYGDSAAPGGCASLLLVSWHPCLRRRRGTSAPSAHYHPAGGCGARGRRFDA
jgi:hypothetical protein